MKLIIVPDRSVSSDDLLVMGLAQLLFGYVQVCTHRDLPKNNHLLAHAWYLRAPWNESSTAMAVEDFTKLINWAKEKELLTYGEWRKLQHMYYNLEKYEIGSFIGRAIFKNPKPHPADLETTISVIENMLLKELYVKPELDTWDDAMDFYTLTGSFKIVNHKDYPKWSAHSKDKADCIFNEFKQYAKAEGYIGIAISTPDNLWKLFSVNEDVWDIPEYRYQRENQKHCATYGTLQQVKAHMLEIFGNPQEIPT